MTPFFEPSAICMSLGSPLTTSQINKVLHSLTQTNQSMRTIVSILKIDKRKPQLPGSLQKISHNLLLHEEYFELSAIYIKRKRRNVNILVIMEKRKKKNRIILYSSKEFHYHAPVLLSGETSSCYHSEQFRPPVFELPNK